MKSEKVKNAPILYSTAEVAQILGVSQRTIYNHIQNNTLKAYKVCDKWRIPKEELEAFIYGKSK